MATYRFNEIGRETMKSFCIAKVQSKHKVIHALAFLLFVFSLCFYVEKHLLSQETTPEEYLIDNNCSIYWEQRDGELHATSLVINNSKAILGCLEMARHLPHLNNLVVMPANGINNEQVEHLNKFNKLEGLFIQGARNNFSDNEQGLSIKDALSAISHITTLKTLVLKEIDASSPDDFFGLKGMVKLENIAIGHTKKIPCGSCMWLPQSIRMCNIFGNLFRDDLQHVLSKSNITFLQCGFLRNDFDCLSFESLMHLAELNACGYVSREMILSLQDNDNLETIRFYRCRFESGALLETKNIKSLKNIEIINCDFPDAERPVEILSLNNLVQSITLGLNYSDQPTDVSSLRYCGNLKHISFVGCSNVFGLNSLANIQSLKIKSAGMKSLHADAFEGLNMLQDLDINDLVVYGQLPRMQTLRKLSFSNVNIEHPLFFQGFERQLQSLSLIRTQVSNESVLQIVKAGRDSLKHLAILPVESQDIINSIVDCRHLQSIEVKIMPEAGDMTFRYFTSLESISLSIEQISPQTISDIASLPRLRTLDLSRCKVNEEFLRILKNSLSLRDLRIGTNKISYETIRSLPLRSVYSGPHFSDPFQRFFVNVHGH